MKQLQITRVDGSIHKENGTIQSSYQRKRDLSKYLAEGNMKLLNCTIKDQKLVATERSRGYRNAIWALAERCRVELPRSTDIVRTHASFTHQLHDSAIPIAIRRISLDANQLVNEFKDNALALLTCSPTLEGLAIIFVPTLRTMEVTIRKPGLIYVNSYFMVMSNLLIRILYSLRWSYRALELQ